jgi:hypothetical protein
MKKSMYAVASNQVTCDAVLIHVSLSQQASSPITVTLAATEPVALPEARRHRSTVSSEQADGLEVDRAPHQRLEEPMAVLKPRRPTRKSTEGQNAVHWREPLVSSALPTRSILTPGFQPEAEDMPSQPRMVDSTLDGGVKPDRPSLSSDPESEGRYHPGKETSLHQEWSHGVDSSSRIEHTLPEVGPISLLPFG